MPALGMLATLVERMLGGRGEAVENANSAHSDELADDTEPREEREAPEAGDFAAEGPGDGGAPPG